MKRARIILLSVAVVAGGLAAFLATRGSAPQQIHVAGEVTKETRTMIMVARKSIGVGERLNSALIKWEEWPSGSLRPEYINIDATPEGMEELTGAVARFEFFVGEPIREAKLARADQGFLSAVIEPGKRGVSIAVTAESGAGGFIVPNDRVDVVLTSDTDFGERSDTILQNVKVLVIDRRLGQLGETAGEGNADEPETTSFENDTIAVLELDPSQSEIIINASEIGELALVLRSVADFGEDVSSNVALNKNTTVRMIRYGKGQDILPTEIKMAAPNSSQVDYSPDGDSGQNRESSGASASNSTNQDPIENALVE
jgi:pilus assembly protein CpaB